MNEKHPSSPLIRPLNPLMKEVGGSGIAGAEEPSIEVREAIETRAEDGNFDEARAPRVAQGGHTRLARRKWKLTTPCISNTGRGVPTAGPVGEYPCSTDIVRMWMSLTSASLGRWTTAS